MSCRRATTATVVSAVKLSSTIRCFSAGVQRRRRSRPGKTVTVEQMEDGVWTIKTAQVIPDNELWLHTPEARASLDRALDWSVSHPRSETDLKTATKRVNRKL